MPTLHCDISNSLLEALELERSRTGERIDEIVIRALATELQVDHATLFQISTAGALVEGVSEGAITVAELVRHGDFGLGTFADFDGEMVVLDGTVYQVHGTGVVEVASDETTVPFAVVTHFVAEHEAHFEDVISLDDLTSRLDTHRSTDNDFFAVRLEGRFDRVETRAVCKVEQHASLVDVAASQAEFAFTDAPGVVVGFWSPEYVRSVNVPGWHLHFLTADRAGGGHVLGCEARSLTAQMQHLSEFRMALPENAAFLQADLTGDKRDAIEEAEQKR